MMKMRVDEPAIERPDLLGVAVRGKRLISWDIRESESQGD